MNFTEMLIASRDNKLDLNFDEYWACGFVYANPHFVLPPVRVKTQVVNGKLWDLFPYLKSGKVSNVAIDRYNSHIFTTQEECYECYEELLERALTDVTQHRDERLGKVEANRRKANVLIAENEKARNTNEVL